MRRVIKTLILLTIINDDDSAHPFYKIQLESQ